MDELQPSPGEKVIVLAILRSNAAILSGALTGALLAWFDRGSALATMDQRGRIAAAMGSLLLGAIWGYLAGIGPVYLFIRPGSREVIIARKSDSLPFILKAAFSGSFAGAFLASLFVVLNTSARVHILHVVAIAATVSIVVGFLMGYFATK